MKDPYVHVATCDSQQRHSLTNTEFRAWIINHIQIKQLDVLTHPYYNLIADVAKQRWRYNRDK